MRSPKRLAKSLSGPVVPPVLPFISRNARVPMYQPCSSSPPTPSGSFSPWRGPAPYPSSEIAKLWTRSLDMESFSGFHMRRMGRPEIDRRRMSWGPQSRTSNNRKRKGRTEGGTTPEKEKCERTYTAYSHLFTLVGTVVFDALPVLPLTCLNLS